MQIHVTGGDPVHRRAKAIFLNTHIQNGALGETRRVVGGNVRSIHYGIILQPLGKRIITIPMDNVGGLDRVHCRQMPYAAGTYRIVGSVHGASQVLCCFHTDEHCVGTIRMCIITTMVKN